MSRKNGLKKIGLFFFFGLFISCSVKDIHAADQGKVTFYLNGGTIPGIADIDVKTGDVGTSFVIPSNPVKAGYDFMGWIQQGSGGVGPNGTLVGAHDPTWGGDGEFINRPITEIYSTGFEGGLQSYKAPKPLDCLTQLSSTVARVRIVTNGKQSGLLERIGCGYNGSNRTWLPNTMYRLTMYVKIPKGYSLACQWYFPGCTGNYHAGINKPYGTFLDVAGNDEYQYVECLWYSGIGASTIYSPSMIFTQIDPTLPQPSVSNPIDYDFAYYAFSIADGSTGTQLQKNFKGQNTYQFKTVNGGDGLTAIYEPSTYSIIYDANGGINSPASQSFRYNTSGSMQLTNTIPIKTGFEFLGWSVDKNAIIAEYKPSSSWSYTNTNNTTLYAIWKFFAPNIISPKTIILDSSGRGSFLIQSAISKGSLEIVIPTNIELFSINKKSIYGTISISNPYLSNSINKVDGIIDAPGMTAGQWTTQFQIYYKYHPE